MEPLKELLSDILIKDEIKDIYYIKKNNIINYIIDFNNTFKDDNIMKLYLQYKINIIKNNIRCIQNIFNDIIKFQIFTGDDKPIIILKIKK